MIRVLPKWSGGEGYDVTTGGRSPWKWLSPMLLGPVELPGGYRSMNVENAWQFSKLYPEHAINGVPTAAYWDWANRGWLDSWAHRYPMGKGRKPLCSWWNGEALDYIEARKRIYVPLYIEVVRRQRGSLLPSLKAEADRGVLVLRDYDAYDHHALGYSWDDVINDPDRKMGHAFVLAMMIEGKL